MYGWKTIVGKEKKWVLVLFFMLIAFQQVKSQLLYALKPRQNALSYSTGLNRKEPFGTVSIARGFHINLFNLVKDDVTLFLDFTDKSNFRNDNAFRILYGGQGSLFHVKQFVMLFRKTFGVSRYHFPNGAKVTYLLAELELMPGWYTPKFFAALDIYYGDNLRGYIASSDKISGIADDIGIGWFKPKLKSIRFGANLGYHINDRWTVYGNFDFFVARSVKGTYNPEVPRLFGYLGVNYIFPKTSRKTVIDTH